MNFFRPPLTSFIKNITDPVESEQILFGNDSMRKDVIRQLQDQVFYFKEVNVLNAREMDVVKQFEQVLENRLKYRPTQIVQSINGKSQIRKSKLERFRSKKQKNMQKISYTKKLMAAKRRFRILGQFISNKEGKLIQDTFGAHVFNDSHNFNLRMRKTLINKYGYAYVDKSAVLKEIKRMKKEKDQIFNRIRSKKQIFCINYNE